MMLTKVRCSGQINTGMRSGWTVTQNSILSSPKSAAILMEWPCQEQRGSGLTASAPVSNVSAADYTNGVWPLLWSASVAHNKPPIILSSNFWTARPGSR